MYGSVIKTIFPTPPPTHQASVISKEIYRYGSEKWKERKIERASRVIIISTHILGTHNVMLNAHRTLQYYCKAFNR